MASNYHSDIFKLLPLEIWALIFNFLHWDSWATLRSLNLSCRHFHEIISPMLFRTLCIQFPQEKSIEATRHRLHQGLTLSPAQGEVIWPRLPGLRGTSTGYRSLSSTTITKPNKSRGLRLLLKPSIDITIYHYIRILIISYGHGYDEDRHCELIQKLVENLQNLEIIRWRGIPFPPQLFQNLASRQSPPQLYYEGPPQPLVDHSSSVTGACYIKSLSITCTSTPVDELLFNGLGNIILSLPNLRRLVLKQAINRDRSFDRSAPRPLFNLRPNTRLPASLRILSLANFTLEPEQAALWAQCIQDLDLYYLGLDGYNQTAGLLEALSGSVPGLKSFAIRVFDSLDNSHVNAHFLATLDRFLQHIRKLECLSINYMPKQVLQFVVKHQGKHLRQLRLRHTGYSELWPGPPKGKDCLFSPDEILWLSINLPLVERVGLDLRLENEIPYEHLRAISCFPSLKYLELNTPSYRIATPGWKPWLDKSVVKDIFQYVDARTERRLVAVDFKVGEWEVSLYTRKTDPMRFSWIYAAWREASVIHVLRLTCKLEAYRTIAEDSMYEQTLHSAGLGDTGTPEFGPAIW